MDIDTGKRPLYGIDQVLLQWEQVQDTSSKLNQSRHQMTEVLKTAARMLDVDTIPMLSRLESLRCLETADNGLLRIIPLVISWNEKNAFTEV